MSSWPGRSPSCESEVARLHLLPWVDVWSSPVCGCYSIPADVLVYMSPGPLVRVLSYLGVGLRGLEAGHCRLAPCSLAGPRRSRLAPWLPGPESRRRPGPALPSWLPGLPGGMAACWWSAGARLPRASAELPGLFQTHEQNLVPCHFDFILPRTGERVRTGTREGNQLCC